ncbi:bacillithiol system redox-active protein YtxJ [Flavobacterium antarcticum]|uniref:bacillithiol system redox-active protein YtxJ n=1 Tax=Flavobacterium antarcticum TaxID=271155 RepID=UPI0003B72B53|nr:bacillithiol system redox-active protein YtxJ [Flavobacterium antarcticum]
MGIFGGMFAKSEGKESSKLAWNYLESMEDLDHAEQQSNEKVVVLFKHSTRCSISRFVLKSFENTYAIPADKMEIYFLDLIEYRPISNEIAARFDVTHQSPQMIVLKDGKSIYDASHESIDASSLEQFA